MMTFYKLILLVVIPLLLVGSVSAMGTARQIIQQFKETAAQCKEVIDAVEKTRADFFEAYNTGQYNITLNKTIETESLLHQTVIKKEVNLVEEILEKPGAGVNVNEINENGLTPLHLAVMNPSVEMVKYLLGRPDIEVCPIVRRAPTEEDVEDYRLDNHLPVEMEIDLSHVLVKTPLQMAKKEFNKPGKDTEKRKIAEIIELLEEAEKKSKISSCAIS